MSAWRRRSGVRHRHPLALPHWQVRRARWDSRPGWPVSRGLCAGLSRRRARCMPAGSAAAEPLGIGGSGHQRDRQARQQHGHQPSLHASFPLRFGAQPELRACCWVLWARSGHPPSAAWRREGKHGGLIEEFKCRSLEAIRAPGCDATTRTDLRVVARLRRRAQGAIAHSMPCSVANRSRRALVQRAARARWAACGGRRSETARTPKASDNLRRWPDTVGCAMCSACDARVTEPSRITASKAASCGIRPCRR